MLALSGMAPLASVPLTSVKQAGAVERSRVRAFMAKGTVCAKALWGSGEYNAMGSVAGGH